MNDEERKNAPESKGFNAPWSENTPYARVRRARRDPELERLIQAEGRGKVNPYGFRRDASIRAVGKAANNPYIGMSQAVIFAWLGVFIHTNSDGFWSWAALVGFGLGSAWILAFNIYRAPSWHRARRVAKKYVAEKGGEMPDELKWYF